jgi:taurine dioxygenase
MASAEIAASQPFELRPVGGALGAEIHGVHLADVSDALFESLRAALREHLVLFFPEQHLTPDQHRSFALRFGPPEIHAFIPKLDDEHQEIVVLRAEAGFIADVWHTDVTFDASPPVCSVLNALQMPPAGGDTLFANQYLAYERLSEPMKELVSGLTAIHSAANYGSPDMKAEHPVVRRHPETRRPSLFVNRQFTRRIPQLSRDESESLLEMLFRHATQPDVTCRYAWAEGTIGIWDNRCTQHCAVNDYEGERVISRVTILGDHPEPAFEDRGWQPHQYRRHTASASGLDRN